MQASYECYDEHMRMEKSSPEKDNYKSLRSEEERTTLFEMAGWCVGGLGKVEMRKLKDNGA